MCVSGTSILLEGQYEEMASDLFVWNEEFTSQSEDALLSSWKSNLLQSVNEWFWVSTVKIYRAATFDGQIK